MFVTSSIRHVPGRWAWQSICTTFWWDPKLQSQIQRAGKKRLLAFQVCDWLAATDTRLLNGRGMMGDGVIDIPKIRGWAEDAGVWRL